MYVYITALYQLDDCSKGQTSLWLHIVQLLQPLGTTYIVQQYNELKFTRPYYCSH